jgi:hypothetical protein
MRIKQARSWCEIHDELSSGGDDSQFLLEVMRFLVHEARRSWIRASLLQVPHDDLLLSFPFKIRGRGKSAIHAARSYVLLVMFRESIGTVFQAFSYPPVVVSVLRPYEPMLSLGLCLGLETITAGAEKGSDVDVASNFEKLTGERAQDWGAQTYRGRRLNSSRSGVLSWPSGNKCSPLLSASLLSLWALM